MRIDKRFILTEIFAWGSIIAVSMAMFPFIDASRHPHLFQACLAIAAGAYIRVIGLLGLTDAESKRALVLSLALAALWRVPLLLMPPTLSTDVYRYVWDGRLQRLGYNPYQLVPSDPANRELHTAETRLINHPDLPTPYPPGAELFFRLVTTVHESARAMKFAIAVCDTAAAAVLLVWLLDSGINPWWVLAYVWNPIVCLEGVGNGHIDFLGALCVLIAAFSLSRGRSAIAALALATGIAVKFLPIVVLPLLWRRIRIFDAVLALALLALIYAPFLVSGGLPVGSLGAYLSLWRTNGPIYSILSYALPSRVLIPLPAALGLSLAMWARRRWSIDGPESWAWPIAIALFFAPTLFPWYAVWLTPFLFSRWTLPLAVWSVSVLVIYSTLSPSVGAVIEYGSLATGILWASMKPSVSRL